MWICTILCLVGILKHAHSFTYEAPENCEWKFRDPIKREVSLWCKLRTISSHFYSNSLSISQTDYTVELNILCSDVLFFQSSLEPRMFQRLYNLNSLSIEFCKLTNLPGGAFLELDQLRSLSLRTHNGDWSAMALELSKDSLLGMPKLESLDLGENNIWSLPNRIFCPLPGLLHLNLTWNRLQNISDIGNYGGCGPHLLTLDVSGNDLLMLSEEGLAGLQSVQQLYLQYNKISMLAVKALRGLHQLQILNISSNRIADLPADIFNETIRLKELYLQNNSLSVLAPEIFRTLSHLTVLDMSNNLLTSEWLNDATFKGLLRLIVLNLNDNHLSFIEPSMFKDLSALQILDLSHNKINALKDRTFLSLANLHRLDLSFNHLSTLDGRSLSGLHVLSSLYVSNNNLTHVDDETFINCTSLVEIRLEYNFLNEIPIAVSLSRSLENILLSHNLIAEVSETDLTKLPNLRHFDLSNNYIRSISKDAFVGLKDLEAVHLSNNEISSLSHGIFDTNIRLQLIRLDGNKLGDVNGLFASLSNLLWLNVSDNEITWFDYALIPEKLPYLDLRNNKIKEIGNYFNIEDKLSLRTLDASHNLIEKISPSSVPNSVELLFLNSNQITHIVPGTFAEKHNLSMVDLFDNLLSRIDLNSITLPPFSDDQKIPEFYIGGNPIFCDCQMEWMHRVHQISSLRQHPRVMDLDKVTCTLPYPRHESNLVPFLETRPSQFLCPYSSHCFALCQCCDFIACDCQMNCPVGCSCYHDDTWATNIVDCSSRTHDTIPDGIPMDATIAYMDGNEMPSLESHHLIGRKNLRLLYLNDSKIEHIENRTFHGLSSLKVLHLEDNSLSQLDGFEFEDLLHLRELYLQNNNLKVISNSTFAPLKSVEIINLSDNYLFNFPVWQFNLNKNLKILLLSRNAWSCECEYMVNFKNWLKRHLDVVKDSRKIYCSNNATAITNSNILQTSYSCENYIATSIVQEKISNDFLQPVLITLGVFFIILLFGVVFAMVRVKFNRSVSKKCGLKWFPPECGSSKEEDKNLLYDAFISHSELDAQFVGEIFITELENGDPCYKVCLASRDFDNAGTYVGDFITNSIESSRNVIILLTRNFIDNDWCKFTFKASHLEALKSSQNHLITVICGELCESDLDAELLSIVKNSTKLVYEDKSFWNKLKSCLPGGKKNVNQQCFIAETNYVLRNNMPSISPTHHSLKMGQLIPNMVLNTPIKPPLTHSSHNYPLTYHPSRQNSLHHHHPHNHTLQQLGPSALMQKQGNPLHRQQLSGESGDFDHTFISLDTAQSSLSPSLSHSYMSIDYIPTKNSHIYASIEESSSLSPIHPPTLSQLQPMMQVEGPLSSVFRNKQPVLRQDQVRISRPPPCSSSNSYLDQSAVVSPSYFI